MSGAGIGPRVTLRHQPLIDGFRGLMIAITVAYHLDGPLAPPGGWVGVSGFLVLSGYLITSLLLAEHERDGSVSYRRFFSRRARRLAPALLVVLTATVAVGAALDGARAFPTLRGDGLATLFYVANWRYVLEAQSYFTSFSPSPLRHTWSLAIEEQFYLVWPFALVALLAVVRRRFLPWALAVAAIASAIWMAVVAGRADDVSRAYYGTDTRAQELLVGALLAVIVTRTRDDERRRRAAAWIGAVGLVAFAAAWLLLDASARSTYQRGGFLLTAVAAAAVVDACGRGAAGPAAVVLGWGPLRALGLRSYTLYLVHWPVIVYLDHPRVSWSPIVLDLVRVAIALALTEVVHRLVERPIHRGERALPHPGWALGGATVVTTVAVLAFTIAPAGSPGAPPEQAAVVAVANDDVAVDGPGSTRPPTPGSPGDRVAVLGDSQSWILLDNVPDGFPLRVSGVHHARCDIIGERVYVGESINEEEPTCPEWPDGWAEALAPGVDAVVVTLGLRQLYDLDVDGERVALGSTRWQELYRAAVERALAVIRDSTDAPIVWMDVPCFTWEGVSSDGEEHDPLRLDAVNGVLADVVAEDGAAHVAPYAERVCTGARGDETIPQLRPDGAHLAPDAAEDTWWWLEERIREAQREAGDEAAASTTSTSTSLPSG